MTRAGPAHLVPDVKLPLVIVREDGMPAVRGSHVRQTHGTLASSMFFRGLPVGMMQMAAPFASEMVTGTTVTVGEGSGNGW